MTNESKYPCGCSDDKYITKTTNESLEKGEDRKGLIRVIDEYSCSKHSKIWKVPYIKKESEEK